MTAEQQREKFENTQRKLREAELFLGHLIENEQQLPSGMLSNFWIWSTAMGRSARMKAAPPTLTTTILRSNVGKRN
jgi:hypothetical protein